MLCADVFNVLKDLPTFKKVPRGKVQVLSLELSLVALGLRSGYLFDLFAVPGDRSKVFPDTVSALRKSLSEFQNVVLVHEENTEEFFFVNSSLVLKKYREEIESNSGTAPEESGSTSSGITFIAIPSSGPVIEPSTPVQLTRLLSDLCSQLAIDSSALPPSIAISVQDDVSATDIITLAAVLLDYPIAYVPRSTEQTPFLSGVELEVYSCTIVTNTQTGAQHTTLPPRYTFIQFSCPKRLVSDIGDVTGMVVEKFTDRLTRTGLPCHLEVTSRTERLDRVAL